jgi:hypothetical protein
VDKAVVGIPDTSTCMGMADTWLAAVERGVAQKLAAGARRSVVDVAKTLAAAVQELVAAVRCDPSCLAVWCWLCHSESLLGAEEAGLLPTARKERPLGRSRARVGILRTSS